MALIEKPGVYAVLRYKEPLSYSDGKFSYGSGSTPVTDPIPFSDFIGVTSTQKTFRPVEQLISFLYDAVQTSAEATGTNVISAGSQIAERIQDIFGLKFFNEKFYSQAWKGSEPFTLPVTLKFFYGMWGKYNAKEEVWDPIKKIYDYTIPAAGKLGGESAFLLSPMPNAISVFANYSLNIIKSITGIFTRDTAATEENKALSGVSDAPGGTWELYFYLAKGPSTASGLIGGGAQNRLCHFYNLIVKQSSFKFSSEVADDGNPMYGELSLNFESQTIATSTNVLGVSQ